MIEYRLLAREPSGVVLAETPWIEIPGLSWMLDRSDVQAKLGAAASDHTPANFAREHGIPATDIEWRVNMPADSDA